MVVFGTVYAGMPGPFVMSGPEGAFHPGWVRGSVGISSPDARPAKTTAMRLLDAATIRKGPSNARKGADHAQITAAVLHGRPPVPAAEHRPHRRSTVERREGQHRQR